MKNLTEMDKPALLAEVEYQAKAIDGLVATVDDVIAQRNAAEAERDRLRGALEGLFTLIGEMSIDGRIEWEHDEWTPQQNAAFEALEATKPQAALIAAAPDLLAEVARLQGERGELVEALRRTTSIAQVLSTEVGRPTQNAQRVINEGCALLARLQGGEANGKVHCDSR